jgi:serine/threonine protein kinase
MEYAGEWNPRKDSADHGDAGRDTLARELKAGRLSLDFLERFGEDLLKVVQYLEEKGVAHRDLKPDNIGIKEYGKKLHLCVFDFSLSGAPLDQVRVGTPPYLEPFLQLRKRWDTAAERYSAAVILYEMATGITPPWGDGHSAPHLIEAEATIEAELFDAPIRQELSVFFRRCFKRDPLLRFDNATEMFLAWQGDLRDDEDRFLALCSEGFVIRHIHFFSKRKVLCSHETVESQGTSRQAFQCSASEPVE